MKGLSKWWPKRWLLSADAALKFLTGERRRTEEDDKVRQQWDEIGGVQIRISWVLFSKFGGLFGSDFKLAVSLNGVSHFVFLELAQLVWLEGVLKVAIARLGSSLWDASTIRLEDR
ncbi:hypothetical protein LINPERHAP1_LOCUS6692 [Linum perenne]